MSDILIRGLDPKILERLKSRAKRHGRSLQREAKLLLEQAAGFEGDQVAAMIDGWNDRFAGRKFSGSVKMIREDRER